MSSPKSKDHLDLDSILVELGTFGPYQIRTYCLILLPIMFSAVYNSQYIFNAADVNYRCKVPECESTPPEFETGNWGSWAYPESGGKCYRLESADQSCTPASFIYNSTSRCSSWIYENNNSIVSEFDLACADWKRTLVGTIHSVGLFAALPLTGYVSDTFGRKFAFVVTAVAAAVSGLIRSFSNGYIMYIIFEFIDATVGSGVYSTGFILALEMVALNRRVLGGNLISSSFALGQVALATVAWILPHWRTLTRVLYAPSLLFVVYYFFLEESVRWLLSKGDKKEAARIIFKVAEINGKKLSAETVRKLTEEPSLEEMKVPHAESLIPIKEEEGSLLCQVIKSKILMSRLCICSFWWITVTFIYYGLSINSVSLAGNSYVNYILTSLVEIPGYALSVLLLDRFGRKASILLSFVVCGLSLVALPFVPGYLQWLTISLTMLGKMCISMTFSSIYIYTSELFPTNARHRLLGVCSMIGRIGSIVAPQTPLLMAYMESLPYLVFGVMAGCSGALTLLTPETLRMRLPDTVRQAEDIAVQPRTRHRTDIIVD